MGACYEERIGVNCVACCCLPDLKKRSCEEYVGELVKQVNLNTEFYKDMRADKQEETAKVRFKTSDAEGKPVCLNLVYLGEPGKKVGCIMDSKEHRGKGRPCCVEADAQCNVCSAAEGDTYEKKLLRARMSDKDWATCSYEIDRSIKLMYVEHKCL